MDREGKCKTPKAKVIRVQEVYPDPSITYMPSCTILHQCGADTGCCKNLKDVCKPKNKTKVELYFLTAYMGNIHKSKVEKLKFENHTECECRSRTEDLIPGDSPFAGDYIDGDFTDRTGRNVRSDSCTCPSQYSPRHFRNGTCICDCFDKQTDCLTLKKGKTNFSFEDRR
ncbi:UNVERIFIED_CONTAM: hypothetical protein PYX00_009635 [Menopon gallinae]|uniref:Platelet-derived growth factor (PDGF) family profile domain-containing protein n=1 Tax=Menopon gallinae TaxID=328185 RepID=A0AAW2HCA0_9NEOP